MRAVTLRNSTVTCSQLGFGCVSLTLHKEVQQALAVLGHALDSGITHFDVAPLYGMGQAEAILGDFINTRRDRVTVTTKFGIRPSQALVKNRRMMSIARRVIRWFPPVERRLKRRAGAVIQSGNYSVQEAKTSLDFSLKQLKTDYVDVLLMHEATPADANSPELIRFLEDQKTAGKIRAFGVGSPFEKFAGDAALVPAPYTVLQFENDPASDTVARLNNAQVRDLITYGAAARTGPLLRHAQAHPDRAAALRQNYGIDPTDASIVSGLLLRWAVDQNPTGVVLFTSTKPQHIDSNVRHVASDECTDEQRSAFAQYVREALVPASQPAHAQGAA